MVKGNSRESEVGDDTSIQLVVSSVSCSCRPGVVLTDGTYSSNSSPYLVSFSHGTLPFLSSNWGSTCLPLTVGSSVRFAVAHRVQAQATMS